MRYIILGFIAIFYSCSPSKGVDVESGIISDEDLFHHINMISNEFPEYNSRQILKSSNPNFFLYASLYLKPNKKDLELLRNRDKVLAINFEILNGDKSQLEILKESSPELYHHANYIVSKDENSRKFLMVNNIALYNHALCLVAPGGNHLIKLKPD